jgi:hypothetical protein
MTAWPPHRTRHWSRRAKAASQPNGMKLGKSTRGIYIDYRYLQFNNVAILTLFRA